MATRYIRAYRAGSGAGTSWADAADPSLLNQMVGEAGAGGEVLLAADDTYRFTTMALTVTNSGTVGNPVTIRGADRSDDTAAYATFRSTRAAVYSQASQAAGAGPIIVTGDYLTFDHLAVRDWGFGFLEPQGTVGLTVSNIRARNIRRLIQTATDNSDFLVEHIRIVGCSKSMARFDSGNHDGIIQDFYHDCHGQDHDNFPQCMSFNGNTGITPNHDIIIRRGVIRRLRDQSRNTGQYRQGDGIAMEEDDYNFTVEDVIVVEAWDTAIDCKANNTTLTRVMARNCKKNFRAHHIVMVLNDCVSIDPVSQDDGSAMHFWGANEPTHIPCDITWNRGGCFDKGLAFAGPVSPEMDVITLSITNTEPFGSFLGTGMIIRTGPGTSLEHPIEAVEEIVLDATCDIVVL